MATQTVTVEVDQDLLNKAGHATATSDPHLAIKVALRSVVRAHEEHYGAIQVEALPEVSERAARAARDRRPPPADNLEDVDLEAELRRLDSGEHSDQA